MAKKGEEYFDERYFVRDENWEWHCVAPGSNRMGESKVGILKNSIKGEAIQFEAAHLTTGIPVEVLEDAFSKAAPGSTPEKAKSKKAKEG